MFIVEIQVDSSENHSWASMFFIDLSNKIGALKKPILLGNFLLQGKASPQT